VSASLDGSFLQACSRRVEGFEPHRADGRVCSVVGTLIEGEGMPARLGSICRIEPEGGPSSFEAEVVGFKEQRFLMMPLGDHDGVSPGDRLRLQRAHAEVPVGDACLGRVIDALGRPIDDGPPLDGCERAPLHRAPESAVSRERIAQPLDLGIRAINGLVTVGRGMRIGIFAGSGVGKSSLLGQIARYTKADVVVLALVGERRREVREFIERDLGDALAHSVVVVSTSDQASLLRERAASAATAIAERFRDEGRHVLLMMDSLTRYCTALREIGLAVGEPPTTRGYTPSVWSQLPRLLERAGTSTSGGSVTGIYTVLVEGDDLNEPVADAARSLLDGHISLSRRLAERGHFPAIDVLSSVSRVMPDVVPDEQVALAARARELISVYRDAEDLISIGAYQEGADPRVDAARKLHEPLDRFLRQARDEAVDLEATQTALAGTLGAGPINPSAAPQGATS